MNNKYEIHYDREFKADIKRWKKRIPDLQEELRAIVSFILEYGYIPDTYDPHPLEDPNLPFYGYSDFHLFDGKLDLVIIYTEFHKHKVFRLIRMGNHKELFSKKHH